MVKVYPNLNQKTVDVVLTSMFMVINHKVLPSLLHCHVRKMIPFYSRLWKQNEIFDWIFFSRINTNIVLEPREWNYREFIMNFTPFELLYDDQNACNDSFLLMVLNQSLFESLESGFSASMWIIYSFAPSTLFSLNNIGLFFSFFSLNVCLFSFPIVSSLNRIDVNEATCCRLWVTSMRHVLESGDGDMADM